MLIIYFLNKVTEFIKMDATVHAHNIFDIAGITSISPTQSSLTTLCASLL